MLPWCVLYIHGQFITVQVQMETPTIQAKISAFVYEINWKSSDSIASQAHWIAKIGKESG